MTSKLHILSHTYFFIHSGWAISLLIYNLVQVGQVIYWIFLYWTCEIKF